MHWALGVNNGVLTKLKRSEEVMTELRTQRSGRISRAKRREWAC